MNSKQPKKDGKFKRKLFAPKHYIVDQGDKPLDENEKVEKKDVFAMILSSMVTIFLPCVLVLGVLCLIILALFGAL